MAEGELTTVYLGLGSNLGDRLINLYRAIDLIGRGLKVLRRSPVYQTEPVGVPEQGKFLNMVIETQTRMPALDLLKLLKGIEQELGRGAAGSDAPRVIDIDILFYGESAMSTESLTIPHPRLSTRAFVLVPLNDLAPGLRHPVTKKTVAEMLSALDTIAGIEEYIISSRPEAEEPNDTRRGNPMYYISVENHFDAAHFLRGYEGKCENLHGHRYKVLVKVSASEVNDIGLAYDFRDLKEALKPLLDRYDHTLLNDVQPFDKINPSAENIARTIYEELKPKIEAVALESVTVWESPESSAEYRADS